MNLSDLDLDAVFAPAWTAIRERHPELPAVAFMFNADPVVPGSREYLKVAPRAELRKARAWVEHGGSDPVITFTPYGLRGSAEDVLHVLLHEAAHVLNHVRPGRASAHHGIRFADIAIELGLEAWLTIRTNGQWFRMWQHPDSDGHTAAKWAWPIHRYDTDWNDDLRPVYATVLDDLTTALTPWKSAIVTATPSYCPIPKDAL